MEVTLKETDNEDIVGKYFKGKTASIISCRRCQFQKANFEDLFVLTLQIKDKDTLEECLDQYVNEEVIAGYHCEKCDDKVEIEKKHLFQYLPPFLFIHLKRLEFNFECYSKIKLENAIRFPQEIDLSEYFLEKNEKIIYQLRGFIVHEGTS